MIHIRSGYYQIGFGLTNNTGYIEITNRNLLYLDGYFGFSRIVNFEELFSASYGGRKINFLAVSGPTITVHSSIPS
jgi:hypothetical protein